MPRDWQAAAAVVEANTVWLIRQVWRGLREAWEVARETGEAFLRDRAMRLAAAVAFYTALSLAPILIVVLSVSQLFWPDAEARAELSRHIDELFGPEAADVVHVMLEAAQNDTQGGVAALVGLGALLFSSSLLFAQLQEALNEVWHVEGKPGRPVRRFVRKRLVSLLVVLAIGLLLLASLVASAIMSALVGYVDMFEWAEEVRRWRAVTIVVALAVVTVLFAMLYVVLPDARMAWRDVWVGAGITAALFTLGRELIAVYLGRAAIGSGYGAAGSLMAMLVWVYLSAIIFFVGAELTQVIARRYGRGIQPNEDAQWRPGSRGAKAEASDESAEGPPN